MRKHNFFTGQPIFSQLLQFIPNSIISRLTKKHSTDRYYKKFKTRDHLVTMLYQAAFQCTSLRELTSGLQANSSRLLHLGLTNTPRRSTIAEANANRKAEFFEELFHELHRHLYPLLPDSRTKEENLYIIDSTTISLFSDAMKGAGRPKMTGQHKGGAKANVLYEALEQQPCFVRLTPAATHDLTFLKQVNVPPNSIVVIDKAYINHTWFNQCNKEGTTWITRQKVDAYYDILQQNELSADHKSNGLISDELIIMGRPGNKKVTPLVKARRIVFYDESKNRNFVFITNDMGMDALQVTQYYKKRWKIEMLFKRIKQRYQLRYFLGESPNAIKIQIWSILICDLLINYVKKVVERAGQRRWSYANLAAMVKHHLMTYIKLIPFLINPEKALLDYKPPNPQLRLQI